MENVAIGLFAVALRDAALLSLPIVGIVAAIGIVVGVIQTIVQVQDQNVAFAPKIAVVAAAIAAGGPAALDVLRDLLLTVVGELPHIARL